MANPTTVRQALTNAPTGTQWYVVSKEGTFNLRKTGKDQFIFFTSGQQSYPANLSDALTFYNSKGLNQANRPEWVPKPAPKPAPKPTPQVSAPAAKPAPKPAEKPATVPTPPETPPETPTPEVIPEGVGETIVVTAPQPTIYETFEDWRVRLSLAKDSYYLYNADTPGILAPLKETDGVIFPYTPQISVNYAATYEPASLVHTNYRVHQYSNSAVDNVTITCEFTAQDTREANYLLAVIHFFRSVTKMFFGQDQNPRAGTPPPLCYLYGMGNYQFSNHPLAVTGFSYNLPNDVDYIKTVGPAIDGIQQAVPALSVTRLPDSVKPGGQPAPPKFTNFAVAPDENNPTWVPTKIQLSITAIPVISRQQMSQEFSLEEYAMGKLMRGRNLPSGGFW